MPFKIRGYNSARKDIDSGNNISGGVCILTSNLYPSSPLSLHSSLQAVAEQVYTRTLVTVCNIYLPPHAVINQQELNNLVDQLPKPFLLLGDFNGHSTLWGSGSTNSRGRQIEKFISDNCLCLLNNEEKTYFHEPSRTFHSLDLAICSPDILPLLNFTVESDLYNSDHFPLIVSHADSGGATHCPPRYLFQRADWTGFTQLAAITRYPTTENLVAFKRARANARRIRRQSQRDSWIRFISSITSSTSSSQIWKKIKAANGIYKEFPLPVLHTENTQYSSPADIVNIIGQSFAKMSSADSYSPTFLATKRRAEHIPLNFRTHRHLPYNSQFKMSELKKALNDAHDTSPGPDGIAYILLRHLSTTSLSNLLYLFNRIWIEQKFPTQWHEAIVIPILKPGKDSGNPLSYRPIALTNCMCKTLERMINTRLIYKLEKNDCIPSLQSGFRKGRSTVDNLVLLETKIRNAFVRRNHLVAIFFDLEKAYDRAWRYGILRTLLEFGFYGNLPIFIKNFLSSRIFRVRVGSFYSNPFIQAEGVPQGSVLSVTLFILHLSQILNHLPPSVKGSLYVDDLHISCQGSNIRLIERQLQHAVNKLVVWCDNNGHTLSSEKSR
ncbi:putative RNA-directed DNA polymerase from transposon BS [Araneus ventricosus]|uniref:Putative RNA-directed DNA polymerase from transposon BS n=1 Tax=Araneus ventricosus TaxID=182803 RepID=A0A4Y2KY12_ARAVE|nr:putative RNA-directed DNA polymerase from transposon BS [Araneus ventricosus]